MSKIEIKKTELVWRGKYDDDGKLIPVEKPGPFPFQIVESINEPRIEKGKGDEKLSLFNTWKGDEGNTFEDGWKNKLIWGDNKFVMSSLLEKFAGEIDLIYIDPPFATGADFRSSIPVGDKKETLFKEHSIIEEKAYRDTWGSGLDSFLKMMYDRFQLLKALLSDKGSIFIHLDWHASHYLKLILDEIFGSDNLRNEIVWNYETYSGNVKKYYPRKHDVIFFYTKSENYFFKLPYLDDYEESINYERWKAYIVDGNKIMGNNYPKTDSRFMQRYNKWVRVNKRQPKPDDVIFEIKSFALSSTWKDINAVDPKDKIEKLPFPTQKPEKLLERIIDASSEQGNLVADFFCGSGTTISVAEKLNRRWIGVDMGRYAIHTTRKRLLEIENSKNLIDVEKKYGKKAKPFEILNLGRYERQFWKVKAFGIKDEKQSIYEYLAFILKLYGAEPIAGSAQIHGKKGNAMVYIGAVDSPVTIQEVTDALKDTKEMGMKELHVLGWEWEMGLNDAIQEVAKQMAVRLKLRIIPMDAIDPQATGKGDVKFFELAYFKTEIETKGLKVKVKLQDFVIPHTDLITPEVKASIKKWSDWIDYWAVDFDFQNDTFNNGWTSYRTKQERKLKLTAEIEYKKTGTYKVFVKIIDIFGIDTSQVFEIKIK